LKLFANFKAFKFFYKILNKLVQIMSGGQEVKFHGIKITVMRLKFKFFYKILNKLVQIMSGGQEVKFHGIKITVMRLKFNFFMRSILFNNILQFWSGGWHFDHEIETWKSIISKFWFVSCSLYFRQLSLNIFDLITGPIGSRLGFNLFPLSQSWNLPKQVC